MALFGNTCCVFLQKQTPRGLKTGAARLRRDGGQLLASGWHLQLGADVGRDFGRVVIDEMTKTVIRDAPEFSPIAQRANRGLFTCGKNAAQAQAGNIREPVLGRGDE